MQTLATPRKTAVTLAGAGGPFGVAVTTGGGVRPAAVLCQEPGPLAGAPALDFAARHLALAGFTVVTFDSPPDTGALDAALAGLAGDALGVGADGVGLVGHGAAGALAAARATERAVRALVTWGAPVTGAAARVAAPWLIVHGRRDAAVSPDAAQALFRSAPAGKAELLVVGEADHDFGVAPDWRGPTAAFEQALQATVRWLARHLT